MRVLCKRCPFCRACRCPACPSTHAPGRVQGEEDERAAKRRRVLGHAPPAAAGDGRNRPPGKAAQKKKNRLGQRARRMASAGAQAGPAVPRHAVAAGGSGAKRKRVAAGSAPARPAPPGRAPGERRPGAARQSPAGPAPTAKRDLGQGATLSQQVRMLLRADYDCMITHAAGLCPNPDAAVYRHGAASAKGCCTRYACVFCTKRRRTHIPC